MNFFARAVVTGFALSLGASLFKRVAKQLGLETDKDKDRETVRRGDAATDPDRRDDDLQMS